MPSKVEMLNTHNLFIHVGAPRTGTSFLRSEIFPRVSNVVFSNKQMLTNEITSYFDELSHHGDGDEISIAVKGLNKPDIGQGKVKTLVSEEHLLWSVYHLLGNVGSRAIMLKQRFPDAKIILTIRRQPEFLLSTYSYLKSLKREEIGHHLKSPWRFVNYAPAIKNLKIKETLGFPTGLEWEESESTYSIGKNYFNRRARHFVSADFSWLSLYRIYADLFGDGNVLVLPQELWGSKPFEGVRLLENFIGEKVDCESINFRLKVNARDLKSHQERSDAPKFTNFIQALVWRDNQILDDLLDYCDLAALGYTQEKACQTKRFSIGVGNPRQGDTDKDKLQIAVERYRQESFRVGAIPTTMTLTGKILALLLRRVRFKQRFYRLRRSVEDRLSGLDFERIESVDELSLDPRISKQYEGSKIEELKELFGKIELPERVRFLDLGAGKGRVVCYVSGLKGVEISRGVEISERLCGIATKNIASLGCSNCEIINSDVRDISTNLINDSNVFYFYNPFPRSVLTQVLELILKSIAKRDSGIIIIYFNPVDADAIEKTFCGRLRKIEHKNRISNATTSVYWIDKPCVST